MHNIWNPWHGCKKISEGCQNCYMFYLDRIRDKDGSNIYRTESFNYPLKKDRKGNYKIKSGETINVCLTSNFFLEEADCWRNEAWEIMKIRSDVIFFILTKRPERVKKCLPEEWGNGWENIFFNVTCENQKRADERIPILLELPFKHKGIMCAPFIGGVSIAEYLKSGKIEQVSCGGENYEGARPCNYEWVKNLRRECEEYNVTFAFIDTGTKFIKDRKLYTLPNKWLQSIMAYKSGASHFGKPIKFKLTDSLGTIIPDDLLHKPSFSDNCMECSSRPICNGCRYCKKCRK